MSIRKIKVNVKLAKREIKRQDISTKIGLSVVFGFILPCLMIVGCSLVTEPISASFGIMG